VRHDGIANYTHMLGSEHIRFFFNVNGAVVTQGWEQYNSFCNLASSNFKG